MVQQGRKPKTDDGTKKIIELRVASYELGVASCGLRVAGYGLRVTCYTLWVAGYEIRSVFPYFCGSIFLVRYSIFKTPFSRNPQLVTRNP